MILAQQANDSAPGPDELYDIVVLAPEKSIWPIVFVLAVILLLAIAIGLLVWHLVRKAANRKSGPSPAILAKQDLREIEKRHAEWEANQFSLAISETLKDYFAAKYKDPVRFETTPEFLDRISRKGSRLPGPVQEELRNFLTAAEELKFGNVSLAEKKTWPLFLKANDLIELSESTAIPSIPGKTAPPP